MAQPKSRPEPDSKYCGGTLSDLCIKKCLQMSINWSTIIKKGGPKFVQNDVKHWFSHKETVKFMLIPLKVQASELWGELSFSQNCTEPHENVLFQLCADHSQRKSNSFNLKYKKTCVCVYFLLHRGQTICHVKRWNHCELTFSHSAQYSPGTHTSGCWGSKRIHNQIHTHTHTLFPADGMSSCLSDIFLFFFSNLSNITSWACACTCIFAYKRFKCLCEC